MTIPSRVEAASLLLSFDPPAWHLRHSRGVAEVAGWLARRAVDRGVRLDRRLVETAALLHDVDKLLPPDDPAARLPHGDGSADLLRRVGLEELAGAVAGHPVTLLAEPGWAMPAAPEVAIVAYADKRVGQTLGPMTARFAYWARRYPSGWSAEEHGIVRARADELEAGVCAMAGTRPHAVRRLPWTSAAIRAARAGEAAHRGAGGQA